MMDFVTVVNKSQYYAIACYMIHQIFSFDEKSRLHIALNIYTK
ncbi:hypothetical protein [Nostoc piscinale]